MQDTKPIELKMESTICQLCLYNFGTCPHTLHMLQSQTSEREYHVYSKTQL